MSIIVNDAIYIDENTKSVGIGTTLPRQLLDVMGGNMIVFGGSIGIGTTLPRELLDVHGGNAIVSGNVGIGTTVARQKLDVQGGNAIVSGNIGVGTTLALQKLDVRDGDAIVSGNVGIGTTVARQKLDVQGGSAIVSGNIGVGTSNPQYRLHTDGGNVCITLSTNVDSNWRNLIYRGTSLWGDGITTWNPANVYTSGTLYGTVLNPMICNPRIVADFGSTARMSFGRAGGVSSGAWWEIGTLTDGNFHLRREANTGGITLTSTGATVHGSISGTLRPNIVDMGSPSASATIVTLEDFTTVHYYNTTGSSLYLKTGLVQNGLYELVWTASGGSANVDFVLQPNGTTYGSDFVSYYRYTTTDNAFSAVTQTTSYWYFDHYGGGVGSDGMGRMLFTSGPAYKYAQYFGSDTGSLALGYMRWINNLRTWDWVGYLTFNGDNKRCWIRRLG